MIASKLSSALNSELLLLVKMLSSFCCVSRLLRKDVARIWWVAELVMRLVMHIGDPSQTGRPACMIANALANKVYEPRGLRKHASFGVLSDLDRTGASWSNVERQCCTLYCVATAARRI